MEVIEVVEREVEVIEILERGLVGPTGPVGPQANINYTVVSSSQTVTNRQMIAADTSAGSFTLTLPSNPAAGDAIDIFDYSDTFDTNPLTIDNNGQNIEGLGDDLIANVEGAYFTLIFTGGSRGWQVVPRYGVSGLQNVLTTEGDLIYRGASAETRLGIGSAGQILKVNSTATAPEWGNEVMSSADKTKLDGIAAGAEVNVNADWNAVSGDAQILNKPATFTPSSHTHGNITNDGKIGSTSGLPVVTTTDGAVTTLALGTANQVLRVNSGATGVEFGAGFDAASPPAIGNTTPNTGAFTTLSASGDFTAGAVSLLGNGQIRLSGGSANVVLRRGDGVTFFTGNYNTFFDCQAPEYRLGHSGTGGPVSMFCEGSDTLAQRRTTNPQQFRIYNTFTSATNHERGFLRWSSNVFQIGNEFAGTGSVRSMEITTAGNLSFRSSTSQGNMEFYTAGSLRWTIGSSGNMTSADGLAIRFGGTSASFPRLVNSGATLRCQLADGSAFATFECGALTLNGNLTASTRDIVTDTTTGTKIGTGTTQKIGFFNATPVVQQAAVADATDAASTQARLNDLLARLRTLGLIAT